MREQVRGWCHHVAVGVALAGGLTMMNAGSVRAAPPDGTTPGAGSAGRVPAAIPPAAAPGDGEVASDDGVAEPGSLDPFARSGDRGTLWDQTRWDGRDER